MKLHYMNDERQPIVVRVMDARYDPSTGKGDLFVTLQPAEAREFEVVLPPNSILWVKKWPTMVMLSYREQTAPQPEVPPVELPQGALDALNEVFQE